MIYKCPYCGESYYKEGITTATLVCYPPIFKDGVNVNPDRNARITECYCMSCGKDFLISENDADGYTASKK